MKILLHFSDSKKGSSFGLSSSREKSVTEQTKHNGVSNHKTTNKED